MIERPWSVVWSGVAEAELILDDDVRDCHDLDAWLTIRVVG